MHFRCPNFYIECHSRLCFHAVLLQSDAIITQSNMTRYCIHRCNDWSRIYIGVSIHKVHPIARPLGRDIGWIFCILMDEIWGDFVYFVSFMRTFKKIDCVMKAPHCGCVILYVFGICPAAWLCLGWYCQWYAVFLPIQQDLVTSVEAIFTIYWYPVDNYVELWHHNCQLSHHKSSKYILEMADFVSV